jgi:hypothetical protein
MLGGIFFDLEKAFDFLFMFGVLLTLWNWILTKVRSTMLTNINNQGKTKLWSYESVNVKGLQGGASWITKYATLEAIVHK